MYIFITESFQKASKWLNDNQGVVSTAIFVATLLIGWTSGIFSALRRRPVLKIRLIDGPTFCCNFPTGKTYGEYETHRTGFALYVAITNVGSAATSIEDIALGYHWHLHPISIQWLRHTVGWFWLTDQVAALTDFQVKIGGNVKVYPFLTQINALSPVKVNTFLDVGQSANGVVYFEQSESWGGCFPSVHEGRVRVKVRIRDVFGKSHTAKFKIPSLTLQEARAFNPEFGKTLVELHGEQLPFDKNI